MIRIFFSACSYSGSSHGKAADRNIYPFAGCREMIGVLGVHGRVRGKINDDE